MGQKNGELGRQKELNLRQQKWIPKRDHAGYKNRKNKKRNIQENN